MNGLVEDLEKLVEQVYEVQTQLDKNGNADGEHVQKLGAQINDLEAHLNTSIITEKSVRKAQDKHLAEELDAFKELVDKL